MKKFFATIALLIAFFLSMGSFADAQSVLRVPQGGTGVGTITGILKGNGTNAFSTVTIGSGLTYDGTTLSATGGGGGGSVTSFGFTDGSGFDGTVINSTTTPTLSLTTTMLPGSVFFGGTSGAINEDSTNLTWDDTNNNLRVNLLLINRGSGTNPTLTSDGGSLIRVSGQIGTVLGATTKNYNFATEGVALGNQLARTNIAVFYGSDDAAKLSVLNTGLLQGVDGNSGTPAYSFTGGTNAGMYRAGTNLIGFSAGGNPFTWSGTALTMGTWGAGGTETIQPASGGVGNSNRAGMNLALNSGQSTGNGAAGALTFNTTPAGSSGTAANSYVESARITDTTMTFSDGLKVTFNPSTTIAGINVGALAGDPSVPVNGDLWYDSTANELTARINGANVALGSGGGTITLTGDVTGSGTTSIATTIADNSVDGTDIAIGSDAAGDVLYYNGTDYVRLPIGTPGQVLEVNAGGTAPEWDVDDSGAGGSGDITDVGDCTTAACFNGTSGTLLTFNDADGDQTLGYDNTDNIFNMSDSLRFATGKGIKTSKSSGNTVTFQAYDVDGAAYVGFATMTAGNNPTMTISGVESDSNFSPTSTVSGLATLGSSTKTWNGIYFGGTTPTIHLGTAGVDITTDNDGAITWLGNGDGFDENITLNIDDTSNTGVYSSSTGLNLLSFSSIDLSVPSEAYDATGWNGDTTVPQKDAIRDKLELLAGEFVTVCQSGCDYTTDGTDDDVQINAALDANKVVYLTGSTYTIGATVYLNSFNTLTGNGQEGTVINAKNALNADMLSTDSASSVFFVKVIDLALDGNNTNNTSGHCLSMRLAHTWQVENNHIVDCADRGIDIAGDASNIALNNKIMYNRIEDTQSVGLKFGGFAPNNHAAYNIIGGTVTNACVEIQNTEINFHGNHMHGCASHGVALDGSGDNNHITTNFIENLGGVGAHGIYLASGADGNRIDDNTIFNNNLNGIEVESDFNEITNNKAFDRQGTKTQDYGIHLTSTATNNDISHNQLAGNLTGAFLNDGSGNNVVANDLIDNIFINALSVPTVTLTGTGTINGLDAIDSTTETTLESFLDLAGDVSSTGLGTTVIGSDKILESMLKSVDTPTDEECLTYEGTVGDFEWQTCGAGGGSPGGSDTQVQFNDAGAFGGDAGMTYNKTTDALTVNGNLLIDTTTLSVDSTNNRVGVGNAAPAVKLHVSADTTTVASGMFTGGEMFMGSVSGASANNFRLISSNSSTFAPTFVMLRSRGTTDTPTIVSSGDTLGGITVQGWDGAARLPAASITIFSDGTPGTNDMPGRITFSTTADGAATSTDRLILDNAGVLKPATNDGVPLGVSGTAFSDLFLASGGVLNFDAGDVTLTDGSNLLTMDGGDLSLADGNGFIIGGGNNSYGGVTPEFQMLGTTDTDTTMVLARYDTTDANQGVFKFFKSGAAAAGTSTVVASGENLGQIEWAGTQQTGTFATQTSAAAIRVTVDGAVTSGASGDMPGAISFWTTPDGSGTLTQNMTLGSNGRVTFNGSSGGFIDDIFGAGMWIDMPTGGCSGIGSGGVGSNAWIAYACAAGSWFTDAATGDIAFRNTAGKLLWGTDGNAAGMSLSSNKFGVGINPAVARLHVREATIGNEVFRIESVATNDDPAERVFQGRQATTDATVTTMNTWAIPSTTTVTISCTVTARRTGGVSGTAEDGAGYTLVATYKNVAGTATIINTVSKSTNEDQAGWDAAYTISSGNVLLQVTGAVSNNVTWHSTCRTYQVSS